MNKKITRAVLYLFLLGILLLMDAFLWQVIVVDKLYVAWNHNLFDNFIPPFVLSSTVHIADKTKPMDYYIAPKFVVYGIWLSMISISLLLPWFITNRLLKYSTKHKRKN
ncbi:hypothetical protein HGA88_03965 [Candidatus Roizmanbacteria bacterium]|nr:hypothetical protein [Candidatus Roizmanbacteria bacterium]